MGAGGVAQLQHACLPAPHNLPMIPALSRWGRDGQMFNICGYTAGLRLLGAWDPAWGWVGESENLLGRVQDKAGPHLEGQKTVRMGSKGELCYRRLLW